MSFLLVLSKFRFCAEKQNSPNSPTAILSRGRDLAATTKNAAVQAQRQCCIIDRGRHSGGIRDNWQLPTTERPCATAKSQILQWRSCLRVCRTLTTASASECWRVRHVPRCCNCNRAADCMGPAKCSGSQLSRRCVDRRHHNALSLATALRPRMRQTRRTRPRACGQCSAPIWRSHATNHRRDTCTLTPFQ